MARESQSSNSNDRFLVWDENGDPYSHEELAQNWDTLHAILGNPSSGNAWPPLAERGSDGGIYKLIQLLMIDRIPIGGRMDWWRPADSVPIPTGFAVADGSTVAAADHDFDGINVDIILPDIIDHFTIGADPDITGGLVGGVVHNDGTQNLGADGSHTTTHGHNVPAHSHETFNHVHTVAGHSHEMNHLHNLLRTEGDGSMTPRGGTPYAVAVAYELEPAAIRNFLEFNNASDGGYTFSPRAKDATGIMVPNISHSHFPGVHAHIPTQPTDLTQSRTQTGLAAPTTDAQGAGQTGQQGITAVNNVVLDNRPRHVGLIPLIKVRHATSI
jgi:hypothetical protein